MSSALQTGGHSEAVTQRERELAGIIDAYSRVTDQLKESHDRLREEVTRLRDELSRKNRMLRRRERLAALGGLAAGLAHEIRNPLGGIQMFASLLARDVADRPECLRLLDRITRGVRSLEKIVTDVLDFGRPAEPVPGPVRLDGLVRETVDLSAARAAEAGVRVEPGRIAGGVELVTDGALLQRALLNLLLNGIDAAASGPAQPGRGFVKVQARVSGGLAVLAVRDNGPGIPPELAEEVFNPFFTTKDHGTGLGLAIVHQIAESLGGGVRAGTHPRGGAVFTLTVPRELPGAAASSRAAG